MARIVGIPMLLAIVCAAPAMAHGRGDLPQLEDSLRFEVVGVVPTDCSLSQSVREVAIDDAADPLTNRARAAQASLPFTISCNTPVSVALASRHGGLSFEGASTSDQQFTNLISYAARVAMPQRANVLSCRSAEMAEGGTGCAAEVGEALIEGEGAVEVTLDAGGGLLQRGTYSDSLTITVTPVVVGG